VIIDKQEKKALQMTQDIKTEREERAQE